MRSDLGERWEPFAGRQPAAAWPHALPACSSLSFPHHMRLACCGFLLPPPGLLGFPPKDLQHRFLCTFKPVFYIRQRDYSKVGERASCT